jgi:hypothetical protein
MKFNLYRQFGALNSVPIFDAFSQGITKAGFKESLSTSAIPVIWSVLWSGRMLPNKKIYEEAVKKNIPIMIIEVGNLKRNITWRISVDHVNSLGYFGNDKDINPNRKSSFPSLKDLQGNRKKSILITTQRSESLQWKDMPDTATWIRSTIQKIRSYTDIPITVRPHPRSRLAVSLPGIFIETPKKIQSTYDDFDIKFDYHCVINHNSGTTIQAAMNGVPVICDRSGLAFPVSSPCEDLSNIELPDRGQWYDRLCHTEWTIEEIASGEPLMRLVPYLKERLNRIS